MKSFFSLCNALFKGVHPQPIVDALSHIFLPAPGRRGGRPLMKAFSLRCTTRDFASTALPDVLVGDLLWAANGVNGEDGNGRTAPSALGFYEIDVYAFVRADSARTQKI